MSPLPFIYLTFRSLDAIHLHNRRKEGGTMLHRVAFVLSAALLLDGTVNRATATCYQPSTNFFTIAPLNMALEPNVPYDFGIAKYNICGGCDYDDFRATVIWYYPSKDDSQVLNSPSNKTLHYLTLPSNKAMIVGRHTIHLSVYKAHCVDAGSSPGSFDDTNPPTAELNVDVRDPIPIDHVDVPQHGAIGDALSGTIFLTDATGDDGGNVMLSSSDTNVATVPAYLRVPANRNNATFPITLLKPGTVRVIATTGLLKVISTKSSDNLVAVPK
jgi:hypothetical protein